MSNKDFHKKEFDNSTLKKLDIYKEYFNESFPVFLHGGWKNVMIYDFFAGEGKDGEGNYGSPLIALESISTFCKTINDKGVNVVVRFNEKDVKKHEKLDNNVSAFLEECNKTEQCPNPQSGCIIKKTILIQNKDFTEYFNEIYPQMQSHPKNPRIIFLDQFGFKYVNRDVFLKFVELPRTDFIFFVASSYLNRFRSVDFFNNYLEMEKIDFDTSKPHHCHRIIADYYESLIPDGKEYYTAHFSLKKGTNYYGLIFCTNHILGIEKFLKICWKHDAVVGEANYNIDHEPSYTGNTLFPQFNDALKVQKFKNELKKRILNAEIKTNKGVYQFAFEKKCLHKHANDVRKELSENKQIETSSTTNDRVHKLKDEQ